MAWDVCAQYLSIINSIRDRVIGKIGLRIGTGLTTIASEKYCDSLTGEVVELESSLPSYVTRLPQTNILPPAGCDFVAMGWLEAWRLRAFH